VAHYTKTNPVGIDRPIHHLQEFIYRQLQTTWGLSTSQINSYPRVEKIGDDLKYFSQGKDYQMNDFLLEDKFAVQFFFLANGSRSFSMLWETEVDVYFSVNLSTVKPTITHRADEEVKQDIYNILQQGSEGVVSIQPVDLKGFKDRMDMQPYHFFRFTLKMTYRYDKTV
jgi:hypothetical protein